jgi:hypothetical protein
MKTLLLCLLDAAGVALTGCSKKHDHDHDHAGHDHAHGHGHDHVAPHGGTLVVLGDEAFHLELVRDAEAGRLTVYVLDAHAENFIRVAQPEFELIAFPSSSPRVLPMRAVASVATGEKVGDTSQFEAQAEWLKTTVDFDLVLTSLTIRGTTFSAVKFNFPDGNEPK